MATRRKHRRKYSKEATCGCPPGTKKVSTCSTKRGTKVCRGRGFGCVGTGLSKKGKPTPRWFPMVCTEPTTKRVPLQADVLPPPPKRKPPKKSKTPKKPRYVREGI